LQGVHEDRRVMEKWGLTAEQVGEGSPDVAWLVKQGIGRGLPRRARDQPTLAG
jgi:hypothetical protein